MPCQGVPDVTSICSVLDGAFVAVRDDGALVAWGDPLVGGRLPDAARQKSFYLLPHLGWIAARAPKRVNRAHGPTKENRQKLGIFLIFPACGKNGPGGPQMGRGRFSPA